MEDFIDIHLESQVKLYFSNIFERQDYNICYSDVIDDQYWNYAYLKNANINLKETFEEVKVEMQKLNRKPMLYVMSNIADAKLEEQIEKSNLKLLYTDVWMVVDNLEQFEEYKSKIDFSISQVDENLKEEFIQAVMEGFSGDNPDDPYNDLSDGYRVALQRSFEKNSSDYKVIHYLGKRKAEWVSTATVVYKEKKANIYNVATKKQYQRNGVCKQMMFRIMQDLRKLSINEVCVQTEAGFYTEQIYKNMGFASRLLGKVYVEEE